MSHNVSVTSFRAGKSTPWRENNLPQNVDLLATQGVTELLRVTLERRRLFMLRTTATATANGEWVFRVLYLPRVKERPLPDMFNPGLIADLLEFHQDLHALEDDAQDELDDDFDDQVEDDYDYEEIVEEGSIGQINRWLTTRMKVGGHSKNVGLYYRPRRYAVETNRALQGFLKARLRLRKKRVRKSMWRLDMDKSRRLDDGDLSLLLSKAFHRTIHVQSRNVWAYLAKKGCSKFRGHQEQYWHPAYRKYRYQYANYFDLVNAISLIGLVKGSEHLFLRLVQMIMPAIYEPKSIKRYLWFIDAVIKNNKHIGLQFRVFKLRVTGKLAGGSRRTQSISLGYGKLPLQTISLEATALTHSYTHVYGEFGMKLVLCRNPRTSVTAKHQARTLIDNTRRKPWRRFRKVQLRKPLHTRAEQHLRTIARKRVGLRQVTQHRLRWLRRAYKTTEQLRWYTTKAAAKLKRQRTLAYKRSERLRRAFHRPFVRWNYPIRYPRYTHRKLRKVIDIARRARSFPGPRFHIYLPFFRTRPRNQKGRFGPSFRHRRRPWARKRWKTFK